MNLLQEEALQWLMFDEITREAELEQERMKYTILAGNVQLYQNLFPTEEEDDGEIEWIVPQSAEEVEQLEQLLNDIQTGGERFQ